MVLKDSPNTYEIWLLNPGQTCKVGPASCLEFTAHKTASLIYVSNGPHGINAEEQNVDHTGTWQWIQRLMQLAITTAAPPMLETLELLAEMTPSGQGPEVDCRRFNEIAAAAVAKAKGAA